MGGAGPFLARSLLPLSYEQTTIFCFRKIIDEPFILIGHNVYRLANSEDLDEMTHFIRVYTVCFMYEKRDPQRKKCNLILKL